MVLDWKLRVTLLVLVTVSVYAEKLHKRRHGSQKRQNELTEPEDSHQEKSYFDVPTKYLQLNDREGRVKYYIEQHSNYNQLKQVHCSDDDCPAGRKCTIDKFYKPYCICAPPGYCTAGRRRVCGTDGVLYDSHCELHRVACHQNAIIQVDKEGTACRHLEHDKELVERHMKSKKKDLSFLMSGTSTTKGQEPSDSVNRVKTSEQMKSEITQSVSCDKQHFDEFKSLVLLYHCYRVGFHNCKIVSKDQKHRPMLKSAMFEYYDRNYDGKLDIDELSYSQNADHLDKMAHICTLTDFIIFAPESYHNKNIITQSEFNQLFDQSGRRTEDYYSINELPVKTTVVSDGSNGIELKCSIAKKSDLVWQRNGVDIDITSMDGFTLMAPESLYISAVSLQHTGNYSCYDKSSPDTVQYHQLTVSSPPVVIAKPVGSVQKGETTRLECHSEGVPQPIMSWQISHTDLPKDSKRFDWTNENTSVHIISPDPKRDSATYQCVAKSTAGVAEAEIDVLVQDTLSPPVGTEFTSGQFVVFHDNGYTSYETKNCFTTHSVDKFASDFVMNLPAFSETLRTICDAEQPCNWGHAVNVRDKYLYVTQPTLNRIVIIDVQRNMRPRQVLLTSHSPNYLHYDAKDDEIWVLEGQTGFQAVMVLRDASHDKVHKLTPLMPFDSIFDTVNGLYVPPQNSFNITSRYAYTSKYEQKKLNRIDSITLTQKGTLDLSYWNCLPKKMEYLKIGGLAFVECTPTAQKSKWESNVLLIDVLTNSVLHSFGKGVVHAGPDSRHIVIERDSRNMTVMSLHDDGSISELYNHTAAISIGYLTFVPSKRSRGYDAVMLSPNGNSVLFVDLNTRKIEMLEGLLTGRINNKHTKLEESVVSTSGEFGDYVMVPSQGDVFIINKRYHFISCQFSHMTNPKISLWFNTH